MRTLPRRSPRRTAQLCSLFSTTESSSAREVNDRRRVAYRLRITNDGQRYLCEQQAYTTSRSGATTTYYTDGFPAFNCHGYVGGSSGSPWLSRIPGTPWQMVLGVIGGLHQGGCYEYTSYSSAFGLDAFRLLLRAELHRNPDVVPRAGSDGC